VRSTGMYAQTQLASTPYPIAGGGLSSFNGVTILGASAGGSRATGTATALFPAGQYGAASLAAVGSAAANQTFQGEVTVDVSFDDPGLATSDTTGSGKKYVELPAVQDCTSHTAVLAWTSKAGKGKKIKVKKATFKVGSATVGRAKLPKKKQTTTLTGLPAEGPVTITGTLKLAKGGTVTVERTYRACG
jgi:hypothetical protein